MPADGPDFPTVRRGYDPALVDAHLADVAAELARLAQCNRELHRRWDEDAERRAAFTDAAHRHVAERDRLRAEIRALRTEVTHLRDVRDEVRRDLGALDGALRAWLARTVEAADIDQGAAAPRRPPPPPPPPPPLRRPA